jgi:hypothetical protein
VAYLLGTLFSVECWSFFPSRLFRVRASPDSVSLSPYLLVTGVGGSSPGEVRPPRPVELRAQLVPRPV